MSIRIECLVYKCLRCRAEVRFGADLRWTELGRERPRPAGPTEPVPAILTGEGHVVHRCHVSEPGRWGLCELVGMDTNESVS